MERRRVEGVFGSILIANRGEIAVRIIQACRELGVQSVAVFSDADAGALHVRRADTAYRLGPAPAAMSYLDIDAILDAARASGADGVHPGYGFLAENPVFARRVVEAGIGWIGPSPDVIALMGDKVAAKHAAKEAGVPIIPGYDGADQTVETLRSQAEIIGYPIMIKAVAGGGGRGMRLVPSAQYLGDALEGAKREARASFGDERVFLEKFVERPRHVEIQVLGDSHGAMIHLGERDCSLQRRHQKVFEESPSPAVLPQLRSAMGEAAVRLARDCGYVGAGTVEFLVDGQAFFFLEMNTRIQVEHPVTEMVTGVDLVRSQIGVAAGLPLEFEQRTIDLRGHAVEARLYAEDPEDEFLPSTGELAEFRSPTGAGIRVDTGVTAGDTVSHHYDSMLAKVIVHAGTRDQALQRLDLALQQFAVLGVTTNVPFLRWCIARPEFLRGAVDTAFLDRTWSPGQTRTQVRTEILVGAALAATVVRRSGTSHAETWAESPSPWTSLGTWSQAGVTRRVHFSCDGETNQVQIARTGASSYLVIARGSPYTVQVIDMSAVRLVFACAGHPLEMLCDVTEDRIRVQWQGEEFHLYLTTAGSDDASPAHTGAIRSTMTAPMPSTLVKLAVHRGQTVEAQEILGVLEAMKMEHVLRAPHAGIIRELFFQEGDQVPAGSPIVRLEAV